MMFYAFGAAVVLATFAALNALLSAAVMVLAPRALAALEGAPASTRTRGLAALRLAPAAIAVAVAIGLVWPAYVLFEPAQAGEQITLPLGVLAALAFALIAAGLRRGRRALAATSVLERRWRAQADEVAVEGSPVPVYRVRDAFPVFTMVGLRRPSMYVSDRVLDALDPEEIAAAVAHERGHLEAGDNLTRLLLFACPDVVSFAPAARAIEQEWARAAEGRADERASRVSRATALALAASLVKVARLVPEPTPGLASALHDGGDVAARVQHLLADAGRPEGAAPGKAIGIAAGLAVAAFLLALGGQALPGVHALIEVAARLLR
jgi:Zn-dependent protease with chaperone function